MHTTDTLSSSPSRECPPCMHNSQNTRRTRYTPNDGQTFEKLKKWTVGHVRALEDRVDDVKRWLVDKEAEKEKDKEKDKASESESLRHAGSTDSGKDEIHELRDEVIELQGRLGELGREMVKIATAPNNLSAGPRTQSAAVSLAPQTTSSIVTHFFQRT
ncbi:uncharacterized protein LACBIDRAFT_306254 [Laccaria bicolor S238N-H82]|uniref:Predicted protein n=1 Tax=Laccaria bicolor (strain S238N-H82 / ATCC MYA-4686) TaxID=486041 RepID=B0E132_LACBS|nr:uncharacterized protein LACBIDRAFT_316517 [Laccaria bicolor S238N-H82]XP_001891080.1 uncharacterized protein LACBIDRAFT_306254 [Laccaria bicolor S238N-H82]EDQ98269.1 predicted protein [Laccaria bicolor S238N-H82]EDQ99443.1 predicted protein [Laccaria bicolor S238N-H82]|eukprot:XP_001889898.1 predicted protein [Laccaria bicolor S238N-H82]